KTNAALGQKDMRGAAGDVYKGSIADIATASRSSQRLVCFFGLHFGLSAPGAPFTTPPTVPPTTVPTAPPTGPAALFPSRPLPRAQAPRIPTRINVAFMCILQILKDLRQRSMRSTSNPLCDWAKQPQLIATHGGI